MKKTLLLVTAFALSACAKQTIIINGGGDSNATQSQMQMFFIGGIGQEQTLDAASVCGGADKVAKVTTSYGFIDGIIVAATQSLVTPRTVEVYCIK